VLLAKERLRIPFPSSSSRFFFDRHWVRFQFQFQFRLVAETCFWNVTFSYSYLHYSNSPSLCHLPFFFMIASALLSESKCAKNALWITMLDPVALGYLVLLGETERRKSSSTELSHFLRGIALGYRLHHSCFESRQHPGIFLFTTASRSALVPSQPPIQSVPRALSLGVKRPGREAEHSPPSSAELKE
jgi:hypothetical protein